MRKSIWVLESKAITMGVVKDLVGVQEGQAIRQPIASFLQGAAPEEVAHLEEIEMKMPPSRMHMDSTIFKPLIRSLMKSSK